MLQIFINKCDGCKHKRLCINGRFCLLKNKYVEYLKNIDCNDKDKY